MKYPQLPEGVAYKFYPQPDATICILYKARGPHSNKLPDSTNSLVPLAVGISHLKPGETWIPEKGEVASLGRALKMYNGIQRQSDENFYLTLAL